MQYFLTVILFVFSFHQAVAHGESPSLDEPHERNSAALRRDCKTFVGKMRDFDVRDAMNAGGYSLQGSDLQSFEEASRTLAEFLPDPLGQNLILYMALKFGGQHFRPSLETATDFVQGFVRYLQDPEHQATLLRLKKDKFLLAAAALSSGASYIDEEAIRNAVAMVTIDSKNFKNSFVPQEFPLIKEGEALRAVFTKMGRRISESTPVLKSLPDSDLKRFFSSFRKLRAFFRDTGFFL